MKDWTIMVYMEGDNNLNDDMFAGILGLKEKLDMFPHDKVSFLIYFDGETIGAKTLQIDFSDAQATFVARNEKIGASSISDFVKWCVRNGKGERGHQADNYALIFSGHGDGFLRGTFLRDDNPSSYLTGRDLGNQLKKITGILGQKLSIIGFDSCVMNSVETAYEMSMFAEILVGSQGYFPNAGWDYGRIACNVGEEYTGNPKTSKISKEAMADIMVDSLIESNYRYALYAGRSIDINWCDLSKIDDVAKNTYGLAVSLLATLKDKSLAAKLEQAILIAHWKCQTFYFDQCIDIVDFCEFLIKNCDKDLGDISKACQDLITAVETCNRRNLFLGPEFQYARGFSLFFPWSYDTYKLFFEQVYKRLDFGTGDAHVGAERTWRSSSWRGFLELYLKETKRPINKKGLRDKGNLNGYVFADEPKSNLASRQFSLKSFVFDAGERNFGHRVGGPDRPRVGGGDRPRIGGGDRPKGGSVPEEIRITKNLPWKWDEWGLTDEVVEILTKAGIIDPKQPRDGFIPS